MIALVLVGGEGTRLRPLTADTPKPMLPILGRPMIARIIEWLAHHGVDRVVFSLAYRSDAFLEAFPEGKWAGAELTYAVEPTPLDTAGAIRYAAYAADVADEELIICNGDVLTDLDLDALCAFHRAHQAAATVALAPVEDTSVFGVAITDQNGRIETFIEKPPAGTSPSNLVNIGTYVFSPGLVAAIPGERRVSVEREVFPALVEARSLYGYASEPYWLDTGTPSRFISAQLDILRGDNHGVELDVSTTLGPTRLLGPGAIVNGDIEGLCYVGADAVIRAGALVADSVLGAGATVEAGARVTGSVVLNGAHVRAGATVSDSVIGAGARVGEGATVRAESVVGNRAEVPAGDLLDSARLPV